MTTTRSSSTSRALDSTALKEIAAPV